jgi:protein-L-isoaspartate(D-aspartate) O-methyltransferase
MTNAVAHRRDLASALVAGGAVRSLWLQRAFEETPREMFVPRFYRSESGREVLVDGTDPRQHEQWLRGVYTDEVLTVQLTPAPDLADGAGAPTSSSSMPTVMAGMLEALDLQPCHRVLEIGTGTGYHAALLCHRVGAQNVVSVELDPHLAHTARQALAGIGLSPAVHASDGAAGLAATAPFDRIIATAATDHIPPAWISQLAPGGVIVVDLRGSLADSLLRLTAIDREVVEGAFLNLPGAFMPMRTQSDSLHRNGEKWDQVFDHRNPQRAMTPINPGLVVDNPSLRFMAQLHLAGRRLRGFLRPLSGTELTGRCTDGSWFTAGLRPSDDGLFPVAQGGPQRLWDTVESCYAAWRQLGEPNVEQFGVTAYHDVALQYVWFGHPDSHYRWPLPL